MMIFSCRENIFFICILTYFVHVYVFNTWVYDSKHVHEWVFFFNLKEITGLGKPKYMKQCGTLTLLCLYRHLENPFRLISA